MHTRICRLLLHAYPPRVRAGRDDEFEAACLACVERERARLGALGVPYAWLRLVADSVIQGSALRLEGWRARAPERKHAMHGLWQDVRYAGRGMRRAPGYTIAVILALALSIGATTAVFTVVNAVLFRALPFHDSTRLVLLHQSIGDMPAGFSAPDYLAFEARADRFESMAAFSNREYELSGVQPPERVMVTRASATLFATLGVSPAVGQPFTREDAEAARPVAVLSDGLWARKFGRDPGAIGRAILLDRRPYTIVGIMPRGFTFPYRGPRINNVPAEVYVPIVFTARERSAFGSNYNKTVVARLKPGVTADRASADTRALVRSNAREIYPASFSDLAGALGGSAVPLPDEIIGRSKTLLWVAFAAVGFVLLIACADIASLMLARAMARDREIAVRAALGAGRWRIIRQLLTESGLLALIGTVVGVLLAVWMSRVLVTLAPPTLPRLDEIGVDGRVVLFTAALTIVTALLCGILPALELSRRRGEAIKDGTRTTTGRREGHIFGALVATQVAIAVVLLVGGGLLLRSFSKLMAVDPGFRAEHVLTLATTLPAQAYRDAASVRGFYTRLLDDFSQIPGVTAVGTSTELPLGVLERRAITFERASDTTRDLPGSGAHQWVAGRYFEAVGIPLRRGRLFGAEDTAESEPVAIINETMARRVWGTADPVGQRMAWGNAASHAPWMRIVGVVGDVKQGPLNSETVPQIYTAWMQGPDVLIADNVAAVMRSLRVALRSEIEPTALTDTVRGRIRAIDPALPVTAVQTMREIVQRSAAVPRFNALLISVFAGLALLLAAIGIGGMLATSVSRRQPELGIRMALGAQRRTLVGAVIRQGMTLAAIGLAIGLPAAWLLSRVLSSMLFDVSPRDPVTFAMVAAILSLVALVACAVPAWRATRVDPLAVLRME